MSTIPSEPVPARPRLVVAAGAGAGARESFGALLSSLPPSAGIIYVLRALPPQDPAELIEALRTTTPMTVRSPPGSAALEPDTVYLLGPRDEVSVRDGAIHASQLPRAPKRPLDSLFRQMADALGPAAVGIVLSGHGSDGTAGLRRLRHAGGLSIVVGPHRWPASGLAQSAIDSGAVDLVLEPEEIAESLNRFASLPREAREPPDGALLRDDDDPAMAPKEAVLRRLVSVLKPQAAIDIEHYKPATVGRRLVRRAGLAGFATLEGYLAHLEQDASEQQALSRDLLIGVTEFFRDPDAFEALGQLAIAPLVQRSETVRVWIPGCASGEEVYSIAMLLLEAMEGGASTRAIKIFATDVDEHAMAVARAGVYPPGIAERVSEERLARFFDPVEGGGFRVRPELRDPVSFAVHDLCKDPPFSNMHLVSCRNVLIYLRERAQDQVMRLLHFALAPGGYLLLGSSESLGRHRQLFAPISKPWRVFRKIRNTEPAALVTGPPRAAGEPREEHEPQRRRPSRPSAAELAKAALLRTRVPPTVLVAGHDEIVFVHGDVSPYLRFPQGEPRQELAAVLRPELATRARAALFKCRRERETVVAVASSAESTTRITASPAEGMDDDAIVLTFENVTSESPSAGTTKDRSADDSVIDQLERELQATREDLRNTVEELESANEELRASNEESISINEELQAANEELEATAEELRSLNEELSLVNQQLRNNMAELEQARRDLANFLSSTQLATLFLDEQLCVKRLTPAAEKLLGMSPADVGRPIGTFSSELLQENLVDRARMVLADLAPLSRELPAAGGRWFMRRILPYRTHQQHIEGVVVTFTEITMLRDATERLAARGLQQALVARLGVQALKEEDLEGFMDQVVREVQQVLAVDFCEILELQGAAGLLLRAGVGWRDGLVGVARVSGGTDSQAGFALRSHEPVIVEDLRNESRFLGPQLLLDHQVHSGASCIIQGPDGVYGVLGVHSRTRRSFSSQDIAFLQAVASVVAGAVSNTQARLRLALESTAAKSLSEASDPTQAVRELHQAFADALGTSLGELWLPEPAAETLRLAAVTVASDMKDAAGLEQRLLGAELRRGEGAVGRVFERGTASWIADMGEGANRDRLSAHGLMPKSGLAFPILSGREVLGVISVYSEGHVTGDAVLLRTLEALGRAVGWAWRRIEDAAAIRENEARYAAILESSHDAVVVVDPRGTIRLFNGAAESMFGYARSEATGQDAAVLLMPLPERERFRRCLRDNEGELIGNRAELMAMRKDGSELPVEITLRRVETAAEAVFTAFIRDLSEQKRAEDALRASEQRFREIFENVGVALWVEDFTEVKALIDELKERGIGDYPRYFAEHPEFVRLARSKVRILDVNAEALRMLGASSKEQLQSLDAIFLPETDHAFAAKLVALAEGRSRFSADTQVRTLDGETIDVRFSIRFPTDPEPFDRVFVSRTDITKIKRIQRDLEESRRWLSRLTEATPDIVAVYEPESDRFVYANREVTAVLGYSTEEIIAMRGVTRQLVHPQDRDAVRAFYSDLGNVGAARVPEHIHRMRNRQGEYRWLQVRAVPFQVDEHGRLREVLAVARDVTSLKETEQALQEASRQKDEFLAMLGHELRNPLAAVRSATELLGMANASPEIVARTHGVLQRQTAHMAKLLDGLLDVSRIVRGKITLDLEVIDVREVVREVIEDHREQLGDRDIELNADVSSHPLLIDGDRVRLVQILDNLLSNAIRHTPSQATVTVVARADGEQVELRVRDTGEGIDPDLLPYIFESFRQAGQSLDRAAGGLGLGLALVRGLVELHGGTIEAHSEGRGKGADFVARLPLADRDAVLRNDAPSQSGPLRILIVEDNRDAAELLRELLEGRGHRVDVAFDGRQALERAGELTPQVVLCDLGLPGGMTGFDVAAELRKRDELEDALLVAISGYGRPEDKERATRAGFDAHLTKPVEIDVIDQLLSDPPAAEAVGGRPLWR